MNDGVTKKIAPLEIRRDGMSVTQPNFAARVAVHLRAALHDAEALPAGSDIASAIRNLLGQAETFGLPDITNDAEAA